MAGGGLQGPLTSELEFAALAWFGRLTTDSPGCFGLQMDGDVFTEFIVFSVKAGTPPPG
jgi:hypothetical protein